MGTIDDRLNEGKVTTGMETLDTPRLLDLLPSMTPETLLSAAVLDALNVCRKDAPAWALAKQRVKGKVGQRDLERAMRARLEQQQATSIEHQKGGYVVLGGALHREYEGKDGVAYQPLTNFNARITEEVILDDSAETVRMVTVEGRMSDGEGGRALPKVNVSLKAFLAGQWIAHLGVGPSINAGSGVLDHVRAAVQALSGHVPSRTRYAHLGWREHEGRPVYLHAGGAIGQDGLVPGLEVDLEGSHLGRYRLTLPATPDDLIEGIRASLLFLDAAPLRVTVPLLSAVYRAVLGPFDSAGLGVTGPSGAGKSELVARLVQHYGPLNDARNLPSWASTANAIEMLAFAAKDALMACDDFAPVPGSHDQDKLAAKAERVIRGAGNKAGRMRLNSDSRMRAERPPRALLVSTGEDLPPGQSIRARLLLVEVGPGDVRWDVMTRLQAAGSAGLLATSLAGFIQYVAGQHAEAVGGMSAARDRMCEQFAAAGGDPSAHKRTPRAVADLAVGLDRFLTFAEVAGALTEVQAADIWNHAVAALLEDAALQARFLTGADPASRFIDLLRDVLASGRAHVADKTGKPPAPDSLAQACGWRLVESGGGQYRTSDWKPCGRCIGWIEPTRQELWLLPDAAISEVRDLGNRAADSVLVSRETLAKRLHEAGHVAQYDEGRQTYLMRRVAAGEQQKVLVLRWRSGPGPAGGPGQDGPDKAQDTPSSEFPGSGQGLPPENLPNPSNLPRGMSEMSDLSVRERATRMGEKTWPEFSVSLLMGVYAENPAIPTIPAQPNDSPQETAGRPPAISETPPASACHRPRDRQDRGNPAEASPPAPFQAPGSEPRDRPEPDDLPPQVPAGAVLGPFADDLPEDVPEDLPRSGRATRPALACAEDVPE